MGFKEAAYRIIGSYGIPLTFLACTGVMMESVINAGDHLGAGLNQAQKTSIAQCLQDSGAVMYSAPWCGPCKSQKKAFGESSSLVTVVNCEELPKECEKNNIQVYPTWVFGDGRRHRGALQLDVLADIGNCKY